MPLTLVDKGRCMGVFGDLVKELRQEKGLSHEGLGRLMDMTKGRIIDIEKLDGPRVHGSTLAALAAAFGMSLPDFRELYERRRKTRRVVIEVRPEEPAGSVVVSGVDEGNEELVAAALKSIATRLIESHKNRVNVKRQGKGADKPISGPNSPLPPGSSLSPEPTAKPRRS